MTVWDEVYQRGMVLWYPHETLVQFVARFLRRRSGIDAYEVKRDVRRILDVGCGNGAQAVHLAKEGYEVEGCDISATAIDLAREWAAHEGVDVTFHVTEGTAVPGGDGSFDVAISYGVLDHVPPAVGRELLAEITRVLRPGGLAWLTLASTESSDFGAGREVDHHTYEITEGFEAGTVQHYFDRDEILAWTADQGVKVLDLRHRLEAVHDPAGDGTPAGASGRWFVTFET